MTGLELRRYVEYSGLTMSDVARELDTSPQNIRSKMIKERVSADFVERVKKCGFKMCSSNTWQNKASND